MNGTIFAIDPGDVFSGYVIVEHDGSSIVRVTDKGKIENDKIFPLLDITAPYDLAIEMVASYGMPVGKEVFNTCVWIGRFMEAARSKKNVQKIDLIYRKEEKLLLCGKLTAKDSNITQALVDRFAPGQTNKGKGTVKNPGFFHGFSKDMWAAMAVATVFFDKNILGIKI